MNKYHLSSVFIPDYFTEVLSHPKSIVSIDLLIRLIENPFENEILSMSRIVIIGNGIAGIAAARNIRKLSDSEIIVISSESTYFFSRTALMYVYMGHMRLEDTMPYEPFFWKKNKIELVADHVISVDPEGSKLHMKSGNEIGYDHLIIASGSKPNFIGWKGQELKGVQGLYSKQDLEALEENTKGIKSAAIIGGGLIGVELAEMLLSRGIQVHFIIRDELFWGTVLPEPDASLLMHHFEKHKGLIMHYEEELDEILGDQAGVVSAIKTKKGTVIDVQFAGLTIGVVANIQFMENSGIETNRGVLVNEFLETSIPNIYAIGDCAELRNPMPGRRPLEQVWYTGRMMGETVARTITGSRTQYKPGYWFNSAKFFDIEYQTYGTVDAVLPDTQLSFVWQYPSKELLMHFVFEKDSGRFMGVNTYGIRLRHELFDLWLNEKKSVDFVLENLASANFDPEFYKTFEKEIISSYNQQFDKNLQLSAKTWWRNLIKA